ncbi:MAG: hypothetical protein AAGH82_00605 [Pseudomonadota bacterium]
MLEQRERLSHSEMDTLAAPLKEQRLSALWSGKTYGQALGFGDIYAMNEQGQATAIPANKDNLSWLLDCQARFLVKLFREGELPPPWFARRVAILLRKEK